MECWVAHASPDCAKRLLKSSRRRGGGGPRGVREEVARGALYTSHEGPSSERLYSTFPQAVVRELVPPLQRLLSALSDAVGAAPPEVLVAEGHRWGAAFPASSFAAAGSGEGRFYLDERNAFAACGDYFSPFPGRVEGAWISGTLLADALLARQATS